MPPIWPTCAILTIIFLIIAVAIIESWRRSGRLKNSYIAILMTIFIVMALMTVFFYVTYSDMVGRDYEMRDNNVSGTLFYNTSLGRENIMNVFEIHDVEPDSTWTSFILEKQLSEIITNMSEISGLALSNGTPIQENSIIPMDVSINGNTQIEITF